MIDVRVLRSRKLFGAIAGLAGVVVAVGVAILTSPGAVASKTPIVLFAESYSGATQGTEAGPWDGAKSAADAINKAGGVNGHLIRIVTCNNQETFPGEQACALKAKASGAIASVGMVGPEEAETVPYYEKYQIPLLFPNELTGTTAINAMYTDPISFIFDSGFTNWDSAYSESYVLEKLGIKSAGLLADNYATILASVPLIQAAAKHAGINYTGTVSFSPTQLDLTAPVLQLKQTGAQAAYAEFGIGQLAAMFNAFTTLDYHPTTTADLSYLSPALPSIGAVANGMVGVGLPLEDSIPGVRMWRIDQEAAGLSSDNLNQNGLTTWLAVQAAAKIVKTMTGPITNVTFLRALRQVKTMNLFGVVKWRPNVPGPSQWPRFGGTVVNLVAYKAENGKVVLDTAIKPFNAVAWALAK